MYTVRHTACPTYVPYRLPPPHMYIIHAHPHYTSSHLHPHTLTLYTPRYLEVLLEYLCGYMERVHPLMDQNVLYDEIKRDFEEKWSQGTFPGWRVCLCSCICCQYIYMSVCVLLFSYIYHLPSCLSVCVFVCVFYLAERHRECDGEALGCTS